jgi:NAD(P)-dependent dehydrogenase (short-subunit alcohol dehydrogenase family)
MSGQTAGGSGGPAAGRSVCPPVALVTGAASGIGAAIAARLAADGYVLAIADIAPEAAADAAAAIRADGRRAIAVTADVSRSADRERLVAAVRQDLGEIDVLVNNAASHGSRRPFGEVELEEWDAVIATNLTAAAFLTRAVAPAMVARGGGSVVNIAAIQAELPLATYVSYVASKGGLISLTRALAVELSPRGIRVNAVAPGGIESGSTRAALAAAGPAPAQLSLLGRPGGAGDVAGVVSFLCSADASFMTGTVLTVDGGRSLLRPADPLTVVPES